MLVAVQLNREGILGKIEFKRMKEKYFRTRVMGV